MRSPMSSNLVCLIEQAIDDCTSMVRDVLMMRKGYLFMLSGQIVKMKDIQSC